MDPEIPEGLTELLQDFTIAVLHARPNNLISFAVNYFTTISQLNPSTNDTNLQLSSSQTRQQQQPKEKNKKASFDEPEAPPKKSTFKRRKSVAAERYDPETDDLLDEKTVYPKTDDQRKYLMEAVKPILLFRNLEQEQITSVIDAMFEKKVGPDENVINEGEDGDNFYVIEKGDYDIYVGGKKYGSYKGTGSFGELALMYNQPRAATITATTPGILWALDRNSFRKIVLKSAFLKRKMYEKLLEAVPMLEHLNKYERMNLADALVTISFEKGEYIIKQGDTASCMYFIESGSVVVTVKDGSEERELTKIEKGGFFGELALITYKPRAASVMALEDCKLAMLDVGAFERLLGSCMDIMKRNITHYEEQMKALLGDKNT